MGLANDICRCFGFDPDRDIGCPTRGRCKRWTNRKSVEHRTPIADFLCETSNYEKRIPVEGTE